MKILSQVADEEGIAVVSEILNPYDMEVALEYVDVIQIGARNMHNFELLKVAGTADKPVLLKRGLAATIEEFMYAAEYIMLKAIVKLFFVKEVFVRTKEQRVIHSIFLQSRF